MIIQICDLCKKEVPTLNTIVLVKRPIEYCDKCEKKAETILNDFKKEINFQRETMNAALSEKEKKIFKNLQKKLDKNVYL